MWLGLKNFSSELPSCSNEQDRSLYSQKDIPILVQTRVQTLGREYLSKVNNSRMEKGFTLEIMPVRNAAVNVLWEKRSSIWYYSIQGLCFASCIAVVNSGVVRHMISFDTFETYFDPSSSTKGVRRQEIWWRVAGSYPVSGLIHVSELSWDPVRNPRDLLEQGQMVRVKVIQVDL
jgi:hypothetical protein